MRKGLIIFYFLFFSVLSSLYSCKIQRSDLNVSNGLEDKYNIFPAVVRIESYYTGNNQIVYSSCSSTVISNNTLLTAAHCVYKQEDKKKADGVNVILKQHSQERRIKAKSFYFFDEYKNIGAEQRPKHDIAVVVFDEGTFNEISPLKISNKEVKVGDIIQYVGFGGQTDLSNEKDQFGNRTIVRASEELKRRYGINKVSGFNCLYNMECILTGSRIENTYLDANKRKDHVGTHALVWSGDSGGPVIPYSNSNLIIGIISGRFSHKATDGNDYDFSYSLRFNNTYIEWLQKIDVITAAIIPLDEVK